MREPGGQRGKAFMADLMTHMGRRVGSRTMEGSDVGEVVILMGLARGCPRKSGGRYAADERLGAPALPFPAYCRFR
jgi:hypothetical protein